MKVQPIADRVLVQRLQAETVSAGGIRLPNSVVERSDRGKVISVGKGKVFEDGSLKEMEVKEGDLVIFAPNAGTEVKIDGEKFLIMSELSIIAVIK